MSPNSWQAPLRQLLAAQQNRPLRIAILGIGNPLRSDDAAGVLAARGLAEACLTHGFDSILVIDAGHAPENRTAELRRFAPQIVILIDAAEMGAEPGAIRWIGIDEIDGMSASTHTLPLSMLAKYLSLDLGCDVYLLGIQPRATEIGEQVSDEILQAVSELVDGMVQSLQVLTTSEPSSTN